MNKFMSSNIKTVLLILGVAAASFGETDWVASVVPPSVLFEALAINRDLPTKAKPKYNSTTDLAVSPDKKMLFVAQQTAKRIDMVDRATETVTGFIRLPNEVTGIAVAPKGDLLYATCSSDQWPAGMVCVVDIAARRVAKTIAVGFGARAPVVTPDGLRLFVCNRFSNDLSVIDLMSRSEIKRLKMVREPYCAAITPDGKTVIVGNLLPDDRSTDTTVISSKVTLVNVETLEAEKEIRLLPRSKDGTDTTKSYVRPGSSALNGIAISPDGNYAFVTHTIGKSNLLISTVTGGWCTLNCISIIDLRTREYFTTVVLDYGNKGMADPWDISFTDDQRYLCITHAGCHELSIINYPVYMDSLKESTRLETSWMRLFTQVDMQKRVKLTGRSPRTLAVVDSTIYTAGYFDDKNAAIQKCIITKDTIVTTQFTVGPQVAPTMERQGEAYFYDASLCFQEWQSCHTCHSFTRSNGLNRILNTGSTGVPKNTTSLLHSWWTPPTTWTGKRENAMVSIRAGVQLELFQNPQDSVTVPLDTFVMALKPVSSPWREKGKLSEAAQRGKVLFFGERAHCSTCHSGPLFTDYKAHGNFVPDPFDQSQIYTPSLVEVWRTGPYGHLGSMRGIREMIELPGHTEAAAKLTVMEMDDLVAYVLSL